MQENSVVFDKVLQRARGVIAVVREQLSELQGRLDDDFLRCVQCFVQAQGNILFTGVGKSSYIAKKLSVTFASLGMPSFFLHPTEMGHGDLGNVTQRDVVVAISHSGETSELVHLMPSLKDRAGTLIALVGHRQSSMARFASLCLCTGLSQEACHLGLAPTTSTTVSLVLGDALAICAAELRGFNQDDFAKSHPSGRLGQMLTLKVSDVMRPLSDCAVVSTTEDVQTAIIRMAEAQQSVALVEADGRMVGLQTIALAVQAKMSNGDLTSVLNQQYVMPLTVTLDAHLLLKAAMQKLAASPGRYFVVFDQDSAVGVFDAQQWRS